MSRCRACAVDEYGVTDGVQYVDTPEATLFSGHYFRNRSTLDIGVVGYIGIVQHKEHSPEVLSIPPGTPCINPRISTSLMTTLELWCGISVFWNIRGARHERNKTRKILLFIPGAICSKKLLGNERAALNINYTADALASVLTLRLIMSYIYRAPSKARNANVVYIWTYVWQR